MTDILPSHNANDLASEIVPRFPSSAGRKGWRFLGCNPFHMWISNWYPMNRLRKRVKSVNLCICETDYNIFCNL